MRENKSARPEEPRTKVWEPGFGARRPKRALYIFGAVRTYDFIESAMHKFFWIMSVLLLGLTGGRAQSLNIATWVIELPETNSTNRASEYEPVLKRAASVLKPLNADILLLHGLPDRTTGRQLASLLRPRIYHTPIVSKFKKTPESSTLTEPPIGILSRKQPIISRSIEWRTSGQIEVPGGFSVNTFQYGTNALFLYTAQFPKVVAGLPPDQAAAVPRLRELAARYLASHVNWMIQTSTNAGSYIYLATDLEVDGAAATNDLALRVIREEGFKSCSGTRTLVAATALSATGWPPEGGLISAFVRGTDFPGDPESISAKSFFAPVALVDLDLRPPTAAPVSSSSTSMSTASAATVPSAPSGSSTNPPSGANPKANGSANAASDVVSDRAAEALKSEPNGRWVSWADNRVVMAGGVAGALCLFIAAFVGMRRKQARHPALPPGTSRPALPSTSRLAITQEPAEGSIHVLGHPEHARMGAEGSSTGAGRGEEPEPAPRTSGSFLHLLRERMVRWLAAERSQLLSSHHAGAEQVLELEERLTRIQNQFESRLRAREQRISDLEVELMTKEKSIAGLEQALADRDVRN
jgi:hypothetical protein